MPVKRSPRKERPTDDSYDDEAFDEGEESYEDIEDDEEEEEPDSDGRSVKSARRPRRRSHMLSATTAGATGRRHIAELIDKDTEGVTLVRPEKDGWLVEVEVVEDRHVPSSGDMLSLYRAEMDAEGNLLSYRRVRRYRRGRPDSGEVG
ncbi:gas vesicle protein GvpO [Streptosporangium amethystogenes subsp. fukuiense]|uniref:Gas vesicle protein GvpO n=1 Tax=Streptosporangium amethystogenes subsp. fukuiense TaxID=698418 RepID=A0ABW2SSE6_9ACTN